MDRGVAPGDTASVTCSCHGQTQERYGRNSFGWSLLMARRLVELGVNFVQVNLGNNESWDLHGSIFPRLRDSLLPPTDRAWISPKRLGSA